MANAETFRGHFAPGPPVRGGTADIHSGSSGRIKTPFSSIKIAVATAHHAAEPPEQPITRDIIDIDGHQTVTFYCPGWTGTVDYLIIGNQ